MAQPLTFDVKRGMYGECRRINGLVGSAIFAQAFFNHINQTWGVEVFNAGGSVGDFSIDISDREQGIEQVCALMSLCYRGQTERRAA